MIEHPNPNPVTDEEVTWKYIYYKGKRSEYMVNEYGHVYSIKNGMILKPNISEYGYAMVTLYFGSRSSAKTFAVHKLVAEYFVDGKKDYQTQANHIDGFKLDNYFCNLEHCDQSENNIHAYETGLAKRGNEHYKNKYPEVIIRKICEMLRDDDLSADSIAIKLNLYAKGAKDFDSLKDTIYKIKAGKNWTWISREYI